MKFVTQIVLNAQGLHPISALLAMQILIFMQDIANPTVLQITMCGGGSVKFATQPVLLVQDLVQISALHVMQRLIFIQGLEDLV